MEGKKPNYVDFLRLITPIGVTVSLFILGNINSKVIDIETKLFTHLTNDEIHVPRSYVVTKGEFELYKQFNDEKCSLILKGLDGIIFDVKELIKRK